MLLYFFIVLGIASLAGTIAISWRQLAYVRANNLTDLSPGEEFLGEIIQRRIDSFYHNFAAFFHALVHYSYLYVLLALRRLVVVVRFVLTRVEHKFSHLIDSVHGRGVLKHDNPASAFLSQMKEHKEAVLAGWKSDEK